ncbi:MAG: hypothetical protein H7Y04_04090, partial [Verrucomicrobia bacterium]|nr:hypothetical protein [Cytophagales bacterium]
MIPLKASATPKDITTTFRNITFQRKNILSLLFCVFLMGTFTFGIFLIHVSANTFGQLYDVQNVSSLSNPFVALFVGLLLTVMLQSTSLASVMLLIFSTTGVISVHEATFTIVGIN